MFLRAFLKAIWLFFPSILFLVMALFATWYLTQGKDIMERTLEQPRIFYMFVIAAIFWVYITWYTSRIIGKITYASLSRKPDKEERFWGRFLIQMPRFLSFTCLTVIILAFIKLEKDPENKYDKLFFLVLVFSSFYYFRIYRFWCNRADAVDKLTNLKSKKIYLNRLCIIVSAFLFITLSLIFFFPSFQKTYFLIILLAAFQAGLVLLLVFRRKSIYIKYPDKDPEQFANHDFFKKVRKFVFDEEDKTFSWVFLFVLIVGLAFYLSAIFSIKFSIYIGSLSFILFAFGTLLILGNGVALISVIYRINVHIIVFFFAFLVGLVFEPHDVHTSNKKTTAVYSNRQTLHEYFENWVTLRRPELADTANKKEYPLIFVLSDGGASRAGYWVASVMAKMNEETNGEFNKHLFCLSGASGGSVGNAAYFNLLRAKQISDTITHELADVQQYLKTDFLTFTLARMLGPDVFRHIFPFQFVDDRGAALARVLEKGPTENCLLYDSMNTKFSELITQKKQPYFLPILCINTTRMQDGLPAVISNIDFSDPRFNQRLDFLDLLDEKKDIKLSTAVVLGASFPYVSPAGRVDSAGIKNKANYFVDGAYFDNSGSGVVNEMVNILLRDSLYLQHKEKLKIYILHIANSPNEGVPLEKVNPMINDLAAPVKTLLGAYGTQTTVNDNRLLNLMKYHFPNDTLYRKINLYDDGDNPNYSMNWVISEKLLKSMNESLLRNKELKKMIDKLNKNK
ncbi:MAG TPA: hypothetical protein VK492_03655 [Chitinophagaceae bacterium]|nr:hypothetical protein [Chitinophagaceae bacterium]